MKLQKIILGGLLSVSLATALDAKTKVKIEHGDDDMSEVKSTINSDPYAGGGRPKNASSPKSAPSLVTYDESVQKLKTPKIAFAKGSNELSASSDAILKAVAAFLAGKPEAGLRIEVHTDSLGGDQQNLDITTRRAETIKQKLIGLGVEPHRLLGQGMGDKFLIATDETAEGRNKNRRVEFTVMKVEVAPAAPAPVPAPVVEPAPAPVVAPAPVAVEPAPAPAPVAVEPAPAPAPVPEPVALVAPVAPAPIPEPVAPAPVAPAAPAPAVTPPLPPPLTNSPAPTQPLPPPPPMAQPLVVPPPATPPASAVPSTTPPEVTAPPVLPPAGS